MPNRLNYKDLPLMAAKKESSWLKFLSRNRKKIEASDLKIQALHDAISDRTNCLECANCCRSLGPRITAKDVQNAKAIILAHDVAIKNMERFAHIRVIDVKTKEAIHSPESLLAQFAR